jgi:hypothetical protein
VMETPPTPPRRQIHLSTMIGLFLTAAVLLWANVSKPYSRAPDYTFGWPAEVYWPKTGTRTQSRIAFPLVLNLVAAAAILAGVKWVMEQKKIRTRRMMYMGAAVFGFAWIMTSWLGVSALRGNVMQRLQGKEFPNNVDGTPSGIAISSYEGDENNDVIIVLSSPWPFIVRARAIYTPRAEDLYIYYFWYGGDPSLIVEWPKRNVLDPL